MTIHMILDSFNHVKNEFKHSISNDCFRIKNVTLSTSFSTGGLASGIGIRHSCDHKMGKIMFPSTFNVFVNMISRPKHSNQTDNGQIILNIKNLCVSLKHIWIVTVVE